MSYDAVAAGSRCNECYLRDKRQGGPVPPEMNADAFALVIGEAPGHEEVQEGRPFVGRSGMEAVTALAVHGVRRSHVSWSNALSCRPPDNNLDLILNKFKRENAKRVKAGFAPMPSPFECCKPRLDREMAEFQNIIALGRSGASAAIGLNQSIMDIRGGPVTLPNGRRVMPTVHPAFVMRMRRWTRAFRSDIGRAVRWFKGYSGWAEPKITYTPSPAMLRDFLSRHTSYWHDVETKSPLPDRPELAKEPLLAKLGLWGIGTADEVMVIPFLGVHGEGLYETRMRGRPVSPFYSLVDMDAIVEILHAWGTNPRILKNDHNGYYDDQVIRESLGFRLWPREDNILYHRDVEPELPHDLGYVASVFTEIPYSWKTTHSATEAETDEEWWKYNALDVVLEARSRPPLAEGIALRNQQTALAMHHAIQRYCIGMHRNGVWINQQKRAEWDGKLRWATIRHLSEARKHLRDSGMSGEYARNFNPGSYPQLRELFFEHWGKTPVSFSDKTGEASTDDETIKELLRDPKLTPPQRAFLGSLRKVRSTTKERTTYVRRLVDFRTLIPKDPLAAIVGDGEDDEDALPGEVEDPDVKRKRGGRRKPKKPPSGPWGLVLGDGRVHSNWNSHSITTGWRLSSSDPNATNWPRKLREIVAPQVVPGQPQRVFVSADQDQGEMKIIAALSGAKRLLDAFRNRRDPHAINAEGFFGSTFTNATGKDWDRLRDGSKCVVGSTRIAVPGKGLVRIVDLVDELPPDDSYSDVSIKTVGYDGAQHEATKFYSSGKRETFKVQTKSGYVVEGTGKHRLRLASGEWRRLDEIKPGEILQLADVTNCFATVPVRVPVNPWVMKGKTRFIDEAPGLPTVELDAKWGYLLGALQGDGSVQPLYVSLIGLPSDGIVARVTDIFKHFGLYPYVSTTHRKGFGFNLQQPLDVVTVGSKALVSFLRKLGFVRDSKGRKVGARKYEQDPIKVARVPDSIFRSPRDVVANYLAGLFDTDGTVSQSGWSVTANSECLIRDVKLLLDLFGIRGTMTKSWNEQYGRFYHGLHINRAGSAVFLGHIAPLMVCRRKVERCKAEAATWGGPNRRWPDGSTVPTTDVVDSVEKVEGLVAVYDLVVPETQSFAANGLINHNTLFYALAYEASFETVYETLTSAEDAQGNLPFVNFTKRQVRAALDRFFRLNPEIPLWWESEVALYRRQGFLTDPLFGFRMDFLDGEDRNKIVNGRSQSLLAAIVQKAAVALVDGPAPLVPFERYGHGTGLVLNGHDRLDFEWPVFHERRWVDPKKPNVGWCEPGCTCELEKLRTLVTDAMEQTVPGLDVVFRGEAKVYVGAWA